jgi:integrase
MPLRLVRRHGSPHWYLRGTVRGFIIDESTGLASREQAEDARAKRETEIAEGAIFGRRATATFLEAAVKYMEAGGERRFLEPVIAHLGTLRLSKIDQHCLDTAARRAYPHASNSTLVRQFYTPFSAVLKHAHVLGLCERRELRRPSQPEGRVRWLQPVEADRLVAASSSHLRPLLVFLLYTGARLSEALYLDWQQLDLQRAHVSFVKTKNGEARGVPLHARVLSEIANLQHRDGAVFRRPDGLPYRRKHDGGGQIKTAFKGACRRAGINDFSPHDCRHTWATWHYQANRNLPALMRLGGWKSERMVLRYAHVNTAELAASINALPWGKSGDTESTRTKNKAKKGT